MGKGICTERDNFGSLECDLKWMRHPDALDVASRKRGGRRGAFVVCVGTEGCNSSGDLDGLAGIAGAS